MELSKSDEKRVQELEARGDWASVVAMATQHLGAKPGDLYWLELRGRALQRQMGCAAALPDLRQAFDGRLAQAPLQPEPTFAAGLSLGLCEMAVWDLNAAAATMVRLSPLAPQRWEPIYNLGVIRALQGDLDGARAAEAALRPRNAEMADALLARYIVPGSASPAPDTAAGLSAQALPERLPPALAEQALTIGNRMLVLPQGRWFGTAATSRTVLGGHIRVAPVKIDRVELTTLGAFRCSAAVAFTANEAGPALVLERRPVLYDASRGASTALTGRCCACVLRRHVCVADRSRCCRRPAAGATPAKYAATGWTGGHVHLAVPTHRLAGDLAAVR
jgi:Flp pilus assembly protein TadD